MGESASYIHMVHHLIEKCLLFNMSKEECMEALSKHANIKPVVTSTVWNELEKENRDFFLAYAQFQKTPSEADTDQIIRNITSSSFQSHLTNKDGDDDDDEEGDSGISPPPDQSS